jgi:glycosyltransferase involved in cell wall biosynthesis
MRILLLSDSNSPHTIRWAKSLFNSDNEIGIFSIHTPNPDLYVDSPKIKLFSINVSINIQNQNERSLSKLVYFKSIYTIKKIINDFRPNILHAHYASSYGFLGALSGFHPFLISVWGSDVFGFPNYSFIHKKVLKYSLNKADKVFSTSRIMEIETRKFTNREIVTIPFGIDTERFRPQSVKRNFDQDAIVIGTIKTLEERYGIRYLIEAFAKVKNKIPDKNLRLFIVGQGTLKASLENLALNLGISFHTVFSGYVKHDLVQDYHNMIDIFCAVSLSESFGVAVLESSACGKPVIVSDVGGLPEVVDNFKTGFIVEPKNTDQIADAMLKLINNQNLRIEMGKNGREKVINEYDWDSCVKKMIKEYNYFLN